MSGLEVVAAVVGLMDASIKTFDFIQRKRDIPEKFDTISKKLPILRNIFRELQNVTDTQPGENRPEFQALVRQCEVHAESLKQVIAGSQRGNSPPRQEVILQRLRQMVRDPKAENLVKQLSDSIQPLFQLRALELAHDQLQLLEGISADMDDLELKTKNRPAAENTSNTYNNNGEGIQNTQNGMGSMPIFGNSHNDSGTYTNIAGNQVNNNQTQHSTVGAWHDT